MDDSQLLAAVHRGDQGAFDAFVEKYGRRLLAFGQKMCGHVEDGEDVFQDTLLAAYQSLEGLRDPAAVRSWLFRVAANACRMRRRKNGPRREVGLDEHFAAENAVLEVPDEAARRPDDEAARTEMHRAISAALLQLPTEQRLVVLLRDVEGLSTRETAEALSVSPPAVKMRLLRARARLRELLGEDFSLTL
jgi:RNA polymerase sigma-70 factor, ECF subfamily